jgi:predicted membrane-bound dolichyl-phosphate-mannose-protein mannosyltransferase
MCDVVKPKIYNWLALLLLLVFFAQVVFAATQLSLTSDEGPQLTSAYAYLVTGDPLLIEYDGHPPGAKIWNALPLLFVPDLGSPAETPSWHSPDPISLLWVTQEFFYPYQPLDRVVLPPRMMAALLGILLLAVIYRWAADLFGARAGLLALFLATFDPNLLAHASLATNDLAVTLACTVMLFTLSRFLRRPNLHRALAAGIVLGLAQSAKLNAVLLLPIVGLFLLVRAWPLYRGQQHYSQSRFVIHGVIIFVVAFLTLWATYGFELRNVPGLPFAIPAGSHLLLWERVLKATGGGHPAFLMGEFSTEGWWYYFPVAFAIKTPLPTLLILLAGAIRRILSYRRLSLSELALWAFVLLYGAFIIYSRLNIGYRHMLPLLPLLYVGLGSTSYELRITNNELRITNYKSRIAPYSLLLTSYSLLLAWLAIGTLRIAPDYLAFFNELVGGPDEGYRYLVDSNLDWGQSFKALARYQEEHETGPIFLSTHIEYDAALRSYGLDFIPLPPLNAAPGMLPRRFNPAPGVYAISTTTLQGILTADPEMYDWFRHREPDAKLGHGLFVYHVSEPEIPAGWIAQCTVPVTPLPPQVIAEGFGQADLRQVVFDCTQSWYVPGGGTIPGWYALYRETARGDDDFIDTQLFRSRLSFEQTYSGLQPPFAIYESEAAVVTPELPVTDDIQIGDLRFLGHTTRQSDAKIEVWTYWQVLSVPVAPVSLMLHLIGPDGAPVVVGDGLGVPQAQWQSGDVLIQRHRLPLPSDAPAGQYVPQTGVYTLETLERFPVMINGQSAVDVLTLPPVTFDR